VLTMYAKLSYRRTPNGDGGTRPRTASRLLRPDRVLPTTIARRASQSALNRQFALAAAVTFTLIIAAVQRLLQFAAA